MASSLLPQALCTISRNPRQCIGQKKLVFSLSFFANSWVSRSSTSLPFASVKSRNTNNNSNGWFSSSSSSSSSFVVKAEAEEAGAATAEEEELVVEEEVVEDEIVEKAPRKPIVKLGDIMGILNKRAVEASDSVRPIPDLRTGDIVEIRLEVPENRRRLSIYKGIVISKQNAGIHTTIRIRRIIAGVGVEIVFPLYSPNVKEIKVVKHRKVRRARLYYLRDKLPRLSTFK